MTDDVKPLNSDPCELCGAPSLGRLCLSLDLDPLEGGPPELEITAEEWGTVYEMLVCKGCVRSEATQRVICELAAYERAPSEDDGTPAARVANLIDALDELTMRQRGALMSVTPKALQEAFAIFWRRGRYEQKGGPPVGVGTLPILGRKDP